MYAGQEFNMREQEKADFLRYNTLLNDPVPEKRLAHLQTLVNSAVPEGYGEAPPAYYVNNHIHTTFSFSPYTASMAVWMSRLSGLQVAGIVDHDTVSGVREFARAGAIAGIAVTKGVECRVNFAATPLAGRLINNPDQAGIAYVAVHGIPDSRTDRIDRFFAPYREARNRRNRLMVERLNHLLAPFSLTLDFDRDILPFTSAVNGGTVTERHLLFGLIVKLLSVLEKGKEIIAFLRKELQIAIPVRNLSYLEDTANPWYAFDLVNVLKSSLVERFYVPADEECPDVQEVIALAAAAEAIPAYAYLGDMTEAATEDKKPQQFEDAYLELLFTVIKSLGFRAVTYMPARNSRAQIMRIQKLCRHYDLFQICGEDINSPRQPFVCEALKENGMEHLVDAAWALVGHEQQADRDSAYGFFSAETMARYPHLEERARVFRDAAQRRGNDG